MPLFGWSGTERLQFGWAHTHTPAPISLVSDVVEKIKKVDELSTKILAIYLQQ